MFRSDVRPAPTRSVVPISLAIALILVGSVVGSFGLTPRPGETGGFARTASTPVSISSFSFQPQTVTSGSSTTVSVSLSGGTSPYELWFNSSVPGCQSPQSPMSITSPQYSFSCNPTNQGGYSMHLDVVDSSLPASRTSLTADVTVVSNSNGNGNGNGNSNNNNNGSGGGSLAIPSGLEQIALIVALVFLGTMIAIAAGTIATAVVVSRRLRQINETLAKMNLNPKEPKPPT